MYHQVSSYIPFATIIIVYTSASKRNGWSQNEVYRDTHDGVLLSRQILFIFCPKMKVNCR